MLRSLLRSARTSMLVLVVSVAPVLPACKGAPAMDEADQIVVMQLEAQHAAALAAGDATLASQLEERLAQIEADAASTQATSFMSAVGSLASFIPGGSAVAGLIAGPAAALAPLLFKRPRKLFGKAVKDLNPFDGQVAPMAALGNLAAMYGLSHSSKASEKAANES